MGLCFFIKRNLFSGSMLRIGILLSIQILWYQPPHHLWTLRFLTVNFTRGRFLRAAMLVDSDSYWVQKQSQGSLIFCESIQGCCLIFPKKTYWCWITVHEWICSALLYFMTWTFYTEHLTLRSCAPLRRPLVKTLIWILLFQPRELPLGLLQNSMCHLV